MLTYCCLVASLAQGHGRNLAVCDRGQRCPCPGRPLGSGWGTCSGLSRMPEREWTRAEGSCSRAACGLGGRWASSQRVKGAGSWLGRSSRQQVPAGARSGRCPAGAVLWACGQGLLWSHCPLGQTKGCWLFMELGLTPGAASGPGRRPAHLAAGCPPPAPPPHPTSRPALPLPGTQHSWPLWSQRRSQPRPWPLSCGWKVLLLRICSQRLSYETWLECPGLLHSPPAASLFPSVCLLPFVSAVTL